MSAGDLSGELVRFIREYGSAAKLLAEHTPDGDGRCPTCPAGGGARVKGPCSLFLAAVEAQRLGGSRHE